MGLRVRLKADFDISGYGPSVQVILQALKDLWHVPGRQWHLLVHIGRA